MTRTDSLRTRILILAGLAVGAALSGCSGALEKFGREQAPGYTDVLIGRGPSGVPLAKDILNGGLMVYAMTPGGEITKSVFLPSESTAVVMRLPNGSYKFLGLGWTTAGMTTNPYCGFGSSSGIPGETVTLTGTATAVQITLANTECDDPKLADPDFLVAGAPTPLSLVFCASNKNINGLSVGTNCDANGDESSFFLSGNSAGVIGTVQQGGNDADGSAIFLFPSTAYATGSLKELFVIDFNGGLNGNAILQRRI